MWYPRHKHSLRIQPRQVPPYGSVLQVIQAQPSQTVWPRCVQVSPQSCLQASSIPSEGFSVPQKIPPQGLPVTQKGVQITPSQGDAGRHWRAMGA